MLVTMGPAVSGTALDLVTSVPPPVPTQTLEPSDAKNNQLFGTSVDVHGDVMVVGSPNDNRPSTNRSGSAYIFERGPDGFWVETMKIVDSGEAKHWWIGRDVATDGHTVAVDSGPSVMVFEREGGAWTRVAEILGGVVDVEGDTMVLGREFHKGTGTAAIYTRTADGWGLEQNITPNDLDTYAHYGADVDLRGDLVAVGAPCDDTDRGDGAVHIYRSTPDGWARQTVVKTGVKDCDDDRFGQAVALGDGWLAVGAYRADYVKIYRHDGADWEHHQTVSVPHGLLSPRFGSAVEFEGDMLGVYAPRDTLVGTMSTSAYLYHFSEDDDTWELIHRYSYPRRWPLLEPGIGSDGIAMEPGLLALGDANEHWKTDAGEVHVYGLPPLD